MCSNLFSSWRQHHLHLNNLVLEYELYFVHHQMNQLFLVLNIQMIYALATWPVVCLAFGYPFGCPEVVPVVLVVLLLFGYQNFRLMGLMNPKIGLMGPKVGMTTIDCWLVTFQSWHNHLTLAGNKIY